MTRLASILFVSLWLAVPAMPGGGPKVKPDRSPQERKIWTSEEVEALRNKGFISLVGPAEPAPTNEPASSAVAPLVAAPRPERAKDPEWYAEQAAQLREEIAPIDQEIRRVRYELASRQTYEGGISLVRENPGITPESGLWVLGNRKAGLLAQLDALEEQARRNGLQPGALR